MGIDTMGRVLVAAKVENLVDLFDVENGAKTPEEVRTIRVGDAVVDTSTKSLAMPGRMIDQPGLLPAKTRQIWASEGPRTVRIYEAVRLTIEGRDCISDVMEWPDDGPVRIGRIPLRVLDFVVDPASQELIGNPEHGGEQIIEMY